MLAAELSQGGWLNFGAFRWSDVDVPRALLLLEETERIRVSLAAVASYGPSDGPAVGSGQGADEPVTAAGAPVAPDVAAAADRFAEGGETAGRVIAGSLRSLRPPGDMPPLREMQTALYNQLTGPGKPALAGPDAVLGAATDEFTDALDSAADILHRRLGTDEKDDSVPLGEHRGPDLAGA